MSPSVWRTGPRQPWCVRYLEESRDSVKYLTHHQKPQITALHKKFLAVSLMHRTVRNQQLLRHFDTYLTTAHTIQGTSFVVGDNPANTEKQTLQTSDSISRYTKRRRRHLVYIITKRAHQTLGTKRDILRRGKRNTMHRTASCADHDNMHCNNRAYTESEIYQTTQSSNARHQAPHFKICSLLYMWRMGIGIYECRQNVYVLYKLHVTKCNHSVQCPECSVLVHWVCV